MNKKIEFTYLTEEEIIEAGAIDMPSCLEVMEEVFDLLSKGDYVMGGQNHNSHGVEIDFPKESEFPNMPIATPDRRFMAMGAYLGGRFNVCGVKWYGSNIENRKIGLPRSIHVLILNDQVTGAPLAIMPANLVSSMRTGAIPGVGAKYLSVNNPESLGLIGAGVINKTSAMGILSACPTIKNVKIHDIFEESATKLARYLSDIYKVDVSVVLSTKEACTDVDVINPATSGENPPRIEVDWLKRGTLLSLPAFVDIDRQFVEDTKIVVDNWKLYEAWIDEFDNDPKSYHDKIELIGGDIIDYVLEGTLDKSGIINLGEVISGEKEGRISEDEIIIFGMGGMPVEDVAWAYHIYDNAIKKNLGQKLKLWDSPFMF